MTNNREVILEKIKNLLNTSTEKGASEAEAQSAILLAHKLLAKHNLSLSEIEAGSKSAVEVKEDYVAEGVLNWWEKNLGNVISENFNCYVFIRRNGTKSSKLMLLGDIADIEVAKSVFKYASAQIEHHARLYRKAAKATAEEAALPANFKKMTVEELEHYAIEAGISLEGTRPIQIFHGDGEYAKALRKLIKKNSDYAFDAIAVRNTYISGFLRGLGEKLSEQKTEMEQEYGLVIVKKEEVVEAYSNLNTVAGRASRVRQSGDSAAFNSGYERGKKFESVAGELK